MRVWAIKRGRKYVQVESGQIESMEDCYGSLKTAKLFSAKNLAKQDIAGCEQPGEKIVPIEIEEINNG